MSNMTERGVLTLKGKRITGFTTLFFHEDEQVEEPSYGGGEKVQFVDMELIERFRNSESVYHYLDQGEIIPCEEITGVFNKNIVSTSKGDVAIYTLKTDEETEFTITQATGHKVQSFHVTKKPEDGIIQFAIDSRIIGESWVFGVSETKVTNLAKVRIVEEASQ